MRTLLLAAGAAAAFALPLHAETPAPVAPRPVVEHVAKLIEDNYVHPDVAKRLADGLRADAAKGQFDKLTDPRDLATSLSDRLKRSDVHFNVSFDPKAPAAPRDRRSPPSPEAIKAQQAQVRRMNWGFRRVDILPGNIGYIEMSGFMDIDPSDPNDPAKRAADAALRLVSGTDAVIVDLRDNGGGSPRMVGYLVSAFTPDGADIYNTFHGRNATFDEKPQSKLADPPRTTVPLYVLNSARTGSAAEGFGYTVQTAGRAKVVGEPSGGGANPGGTFPAGDGFGVFISTGEPINPISHKNWEGTGVAPDIAAPWNKALEAAEIDALKTLLKTEPADPAAESRRSVLAVLERAPDVKPKSGLDTYAGAYGARRLAVENGRLVLRRDRLPEVVLLPLGDDLFTIEGKPDLRVQFERDVQGQVSGYLQRGPGQPEVRVARGA